MTRPISEQLPPEDEEPQPEEQHLPRSRRRRARTILAGGDVSERAEFMADLVHQGTATLDFYLFALLSGIVVGAAILFNSPALFVLAALLAPFMAPVIGMALATATGSLGLFLRSLASLVVGGLVILLLGAGAGLIQGSAAVNASQVYPHAQFSWPDLAVLVLGTIVTVYLVVRNPRSKPLVSSVALAYELFLPLGAAGYGFILSQGPSGGAGLWPDGLILFAAYMAVAVMVGTIVFILQGVRPMRTTGYPIGLLLFALMLAASYLLILPGMPLGSQPTPAPVVVVQSATPEEPASPTWTLLPVATDTPVPPTATRTATATLIPSLTASATLPPTATPVWGLVNAGEANGVIIRAEPNSNTVVTTLLNGNLIQILPEQVNKAGVIWIHVRSPDGKEGWVQAALVLTTTPTPKY
jgi:uncharacterized membrane protein